MSRQFGWAALCAAAALACAGPASADIVRFDASGFFFEVTGPAGWYGAPLPTCGTVGPCVSHRGDRDFVDFNGAPAALHPTFALSFTIDTDRGDLAQGPALATFDWAAADGPSPLLSGLLDLSFPDSVIDLSAATSISLRQEVTPGPPTGRYVFTLAGPEFALTLIQIQSATTATLTQTQTFPNFSFGIFSKVTTAPYDLTFSNTQFFSITNLGPSPAAIPEPSTWGLMLLGFGGLGCVLRRRRWAARPI